MDDAGPPRSLGTAIKARRLELGWSQEELAHRVADLGDDAFRQSDVSRLELGKVGLPHRERLGRIAAVLELSLGELLARSGWAGASTAFAPDEPMPSDLPLAPATLIREPPPFSMGVEERLPPEPREATFRLREAIARADATRARAQEILARSEALRALYARPMWVSRPRQRSGEPPTAPERSRRSPSPR